MWGNKGRRAAAEEIRAETGDPGRERSVTSSRDPEREDIIHVEEPSLPHTHTPGLNILINVNITIADGHNQYVSGNTLVYSFLA